MTACELQQNDWVLVNGTPEKVREIAYDENAELYISTACSATLFRWYMDKVEPITLTDDILELNNFKRTYDYQGVERVYKLNGFVVKVTYHSNEPWFRVAIGNVTVTLKYVHELQHAMRVVSYLREPADNFKVK